MVVVHSKVKEKFQDVTLTKKISIVFAELIKSFR